MEQAKISCLSSEELADKARAGSTECFAELVRRHSGALFSFLYRKVSNRQDAEDLSQETFARAFSRIDQYQPRYRFATWLFTIGWRLTCSFYRDRETAASLPIETVSNEIAQGLPAAVRDSGNLWKKIGAVLPESQSRVLWYRYGEGMSIEEIARATGKSEVNVKVLLHRARLKLISRKEMLKINDSQTGVNFAGGRK